MANSKENTDYSAYATIDTAPGGTGYFTDAVSMRQNHTSRLFFSIREATDSPSSASVVTVTLQFKCHGDAGWTDYYNDGTDYVIGDRKEITGNAGNVQWRAGVKLGDYTSGSIVVGLDW